MASNAVTFHRSSQPAPLAVDRSAVPHAVQRDWKQITDADLSAWQALAPRAAEPNPFFEPWYLMPALRAHGYDAKVSLFVLERDGEWLGLLPIARQPRYYAKPIPNLSGWMHANCFLGAPLVAQGYERVFWQALLSWADGNAKTALFLHLAQVPLEGSLAGALREELHETGRTGGIVHCQERALLASELSPEDYLDASMSGKKRKELRRQANRLAEEGELGFERRESTHGLAEWTEAFLALEKAGWKGNAGSALASAPATAALFRDALVGAAAAGRLERLMLTLDGRPIAMLANFLAAPGSFSYKTAFDENYARFSPGVLLQRENLTILERPGIDWCDSCAAADHPMIDHIWRERRAVGALSIAIGGALRRALFRPLLSAELGRRPDGARL
ncbi:GNAT family N-acetyltransferase [Novosphingobium sp.]|uniref:GNAT family N-acetyltransferase n=1 Tax=Novosphingobium sp. TaxID=1874826 RepID=UPI00286E50BE|nr:GNAT family N-acetyltransferase [Novosphingobium sp.]